VTRVHAELKTTVNSGSRANVMNTAAEENIHLPRQQSCDLTRGTNAKHYTAIKLGLNYTSRVNGNDTEN